MLSLIMFVLYSQLPLINGLERAMLAMLQGRARQLLDRWQQDIQDQSKEFTSLSHKAAAAPNLTRGEKKVAREDEEARQRRGAEREARRWVHVIHLPYIPLNIAFTPVTSFTPNNTYFLTPTTLQYCFLPLSSPNPKTFPSYCEQLSILPQHHLFHVPRPSRQQPLPIPNMTHSPSY